VASERDSGRELIFSARRKDFDVQAFRAGGPGGQHQNKTSSAIRITHKASGLSAESRSHKSQAANRRAAFRKLVPKLVALYCKQDDVERYAAGVEVVRTYHEPDDRIVDHETGARYSFKEVIGKGRASKMIEERACKLVNTKK